MTQQPTDVNVSWEKATTESGVTYEIGRTEQELDVINGEGDKQIFGFFEGKKNFSIHVDWPCSLERAGFTQTSQEIADKTGISSYRVTGAIGDLWYKLEIYNTKNYKYTFKHDGNNEEYTLNCFVTGYHTLRFTSDKSGDEGATITYVSGT